jgi:formylglycine-generating enzyme required for sulfatase activity
MIPSQQMRLIKWCIPALAIFVTCASANAADPKPVDFLTDVKPILEQNCLACHNAKHASENGDYRLDVKEEAFKPHKKTQRIAPGKPDDSALYYLTVLPADDKGRMPPKDRSGPIPAEKADILKRWIAEGANWPDGATLAAAMKIDFVRDVQPILEQGGPLSAQAKDILRQWLDQGAPWPPEVKFIVNAGTGAVKDKRTVMVEEIHRRILENSPEQNQQQMMAYTNTVPGSAVNYVMLPIPAGEFLMGSPTTEAHRNADEGPQHKVAIEPFWMEQCEVTWNEYELFMYPDETKAAPPVSGTTNYTSNVADAVTRPTKPYVEMSFGMGKDGYPAISMTQHACNIYCEWLSAKTGHFYRLPTEAEWEYACRAGTTTAYFFGDDPAKLGDYAWYGDNSDLKYQKVGKKKPNPWGLYDIIGNVDEWTLDQYDTNYYQQFTALVTEPWNKSTKPYPQVVRGGSWQDDADKLRSACRRSSSPDWKMQDPQLPKSIWYHTDAPFVGFRIIRPLKVPSTDEMLKYWHSGVERD